jgi:hypothetical protein
MEYILPTLVYALDMSVLLRDFGEGWSSVSRELQGDLLSFGIRITCSTYARLRQITHVHFYLGTNNSVIQPSTNGFPDTEFYCGIFAKRRDVEPQEQPLLASASETTFVSKQRLGKHVPRQRIRMHCWKLFFLLGPCKKII